jgi:hypothetical protein
MTDDVYVKRIEDQPRQLGRQVRHDPASRRFAARADVDRSAWRSKTIRVYDPAPNPDQPVGCCTMCAKASQMNAVGNRKAGVVFDLDWALQGYRVVTQIDPFPGTWEPDDTGSDGLSSCKAAQALGVGGDYRWFFGGADEIVSYLSTDPEPIPVSNGTWWTEDMFRMLDSRGLVEPTGPKVGGHQWVTIGYDKVRDQTINLCWWGPLYRRFRLAREHHNDLLMDDGDAHIQTRV